MAAYQAWQFQPESYGAKGDGQVVSDVVTNGTTTITSATAGFSAADAGKHVIINGANGAAAAPLLTTITSVVNSTTVVLALTAGISATGCAMVWFTDDTAAINSAVSAAKTYALAHGYFAEVVFGPYIYGVAAAATQSTTPAVYNSQISIPYPDLTGAGRKLVLAFTGAGDNGTAQFWESTAPNLGGTCLVSSQTAPASVSGQFGIQSVIGGPSGNGAFTGGVANTEFHIDGIAVYCPAFTNMKAYNFGFLAGVTWGSFSANIFAPANAGRKPYLSDLPGLVAFQSTIGIGAVFPYNGNNDCVTGLRFAVEGYETGFSATDHFSCPSVCAVYVDLAWLIDNANGVGGGNSHLIWIGNLSVEAYNGAILCNQGYATVDVCLDTETTAGADPSYDVKDQGSNLHGTVRVGDAGARTNRLPVVVNCADLVVVNDFIGPGHWATPPAVPASGAAQANTAWRPAAIVVHTGVGVTVTAVTIDGTATGLTMAASSSLALPLVQAGKNVTLTYAGGTPTWDWWLL